MKKPREFLRLRSRAKGQTRKARNIQPPSLDFEGKKRGGSKYKNLQRFTVSQDVGDNMGRLLNANTFTSSSLLALTIAQMAAVIHLNLPQVAQSQS